MGYSSGTDIFDAMVEKIHESSLGPEESAEFVLVLLEALEAADWDTHADSVYWFHPLVRKVLKTAHPDWDWEPESEGTLGHVDALDKYGQVLEAGDEVIYKGVLHSIDSIIQDDGTALGDDVLRYPKLKLFDMLGAWSECFSAEVEKR